jgi:hypothetical protein
MTKQIGRRDFIRGAVAIGAGVAFMPRLARAGDGTSGGIWLGGDLHCHTTFSHDVWGGPDDDNTGPEDAYTFGWTPGEQILNAQVRGLDFLAITDHNDVRALTDAAFAAAPITMVPGYEHSLSKGHAGCLGITEKFSMNTSTDAGANALAAAVRERNGLFILNHPFYGDGWGYTPAVRPDSIEVWNIGWPYRHVAPDVPPAPSVSDNYKSLPYWEQEFLANGKMPATGGSDNHYRGTAGEQGVGQPTTWVYAANNSWRAILDGIKAGRTTVSAEPALLGGARTFLTATSGLSAWMIGDTVPASAGEVTVTLQVQNAPGHTARLIVDGIERLRTTVTLPDEAISIKVDAASANRVRAEVLLDEGYWMTAITSPIYFG